MAAPTEVFKSFTLEQLQVIAKHERIHEKNFDLDLSKKSAVVKAVSREATDAGVRQLVSLFKLATLKEICEPLELDFTKNNPNHKASYQKRLKEKMVEMGVADFLNEFMDEKRLKIFVETLGEAPEGKDKKSLLEQATRLINFTGISTFLSTFDTPFLQELMSEMKLKCKTDNKNSILEAIAMQTDAHAEDVDREEITFSKEKLPIKKGITYQDIFQHYVSEELVEYCRKNELKVSGKKPILINRILAFLDGDLENTKAINRSEKKEKEEKKEGKKEKKSEKKKETKKKEEKKQESESESESENEEAASEPEEKKEVEKPASPKNSKKSPADTKKKTEEKVVEKKEAEASEDEAVSEQEDKKEKKAKNTKKTSKKN